MTTLVSPARRTSARLQAKTTLVGKLHMGVQTDGDCGDGSETEREDEPRVSLLNRFGLEGRSSVFDGLSAVIRRTTERVVTAREESEPMVVVKHEDQEPSFILQPGALVSAQPTLPQELLSRESSPVVQSSYGLMDWIVVATGVIVVIPFVVVAALDAVVFGTYILSLVVIFSIDLFDFAEDQAAGAEFAMRSWHAEIDASVVPLVQAILHLQLVVAQLIVLHFHRLVVVGFMLFAVRWKLGRKIQRV